MNFLSSVFDKSKLYLASFFVTFSLLAEISFYEELHHEPDGLTIVVNLKLIGSFRLDYEYGIEYEYEF